MKLWKHLTAALLTSTALVATGAVQAADTPTTPPKGVQMANAAKVQELMGKGAKLIDTRKAMEFSESTIKGAISVPYDPEKSAKDAGFDPKEDKFNFAGKLPDKSAVIVTFCNSGSCWKSYKAAKVLADNGYKHVYWYRDGMPDWKAKKLPTE